MFFLLGILLITRPLAVVEAGTCESQAIVYNAAERGDTTLLSRLLESGMNVNAVSKQGRSALHISAGRGQVESVKLLLSHHAEVDILDEFGDTPLFEPRYMRKWTLLNSWSLAARRLIQSIKMAGLLYSWSSLAMKKARRVLKSCAF